MYHLNQQQISIEIRRPHLTKMRKRLLRQLQMPGLSSEMRTYLKQALDQLGEPKVYAPDAPEKPGAIDPGPMGLDLPDIDFDNATASSLAAHPHTHLVRHAIEMELDVQIADTKAQVISKILAHVQGGTP